MKKILSLLALTSLMSLVPLLSHAAAEGDSEGALQYLFVLLCVVLIIAFVIGAYVMVALMAKSRKRNIILWLLLSIIASPILIIIILFCIGDAEKIREIE